MPAQSRVCTISTCVDHELFYLKVQQQKCVDSFSALVQVYKNPLAVYTVHAFVYNTRVFENYEISLKNRLKRLEEQN